MTRLAVLVLIAVDAYLITATRVGPTVLASDSGFGLHVLDLAVLAMTVPFIVLLLLRSLKD